ncbi:MAG: MmgE/PrpD family protein [Alphaproteobacteria bacterium]|nr:MmgE/PrpD family protein [Alphaproteobacteria bacterium]
MTIANEWAAFGCRTAGMPLPADAEARAALCVADHLHAALHGARSGTGELLGRYLGPRRAQPPTAQGAEGEALLLGVLSAVHEIDDVHQDTSMHPGSVVVAAALAAAAESAASGKRVLAAVAVGYEIGIRLSIAAGHRHYHFFHATGTCGAVAAAAASAAVYGLGPDETANALGIAATSASGLWEDIANKAVGIKHLHSGFAAERGVRAAKLARLGLRAADRSIEGDRGFLAALAQPGRHAPTEQAAPDSAAIRAILLDGLGERWAIMRNFFKRYPLCLGCFEPLEGIRHFVREFAGRLAEVDAILVEMIPPTAELVGLTDPRDPFEAKFSACFALSLVLAGRDPERVRMPADWLDDSAVRRWYPRIRIAGSDAMPRRRAKITVAWKNGGHDVIDKPFRNLEQAEVSARFAEACREYLQQCGPTLTARIQGLAMLPDLAETMALVRAALGREGPVAGTLAGGY